MERAQGKRRAPEERGKQVGDRDKPHGEEPTPAEGDKPKVPDRWWADLGDKRRENKRLTSGPAGAHFFRSARGFEQERARSRLTDNNLKLLTEANPAEGTWGYVQLAETQHPEASRQRLMQRIPMPSFARGAVIDSGESVRLLVTGARIGARILEIALGGAPSFDCWIDGEWVREEVFPNVDVAIKATPALIATYLSPEGIAAWESRRARA